MSAVDIEAQRAGTPSRRSERMAKAARTLVLGSTLSIATMLIGLVTTPILLHKLGPDRIGANRALVDWFGYVALAEVGIGPAFSVFLLRAIAKHDDESVDGLIKFGVRLFSCIAALLVVLGVSLSFFLPHVIVVPTYLVGELRLAGVICAGMTALYPVAIFRSFLDVSQRAYETSAALLVQSLLTTGLSLLFAFEGLGLPSLALAAAVGMTASSVIIVLRARSGRRSLRSAKMIPVPRRELWVTSWPIAVASFANRLNLMTDTLTVGILLDAKSVAVLFLTQRLVLLAGGQINGVVGASWAGLADLRAKGEAGAFAHRIEELTTIVVGVGMVLNGTIATYNESFVTLWVGTAEYGGRLLTGITALSNVVYGFLLMFEWLIDMHGGTRKRLAISVAGSLLNIALSIAGVLTFGLAGVALGTLCAYLLSDAWNAPRTASILFGLSLRRISGAAARGLALGAMWWGALFVGTRFSTAPASWIGFVIQFGCAGLGSLVYSWFVVLRESDRTLWRARVASRLGPRWHAGQQ